MERKDVEIKVKEIIINHLDLKKTTDDISNDEKIIDDLGFDSLDTVELVMSFEDEYGFNIEDSEAEKIITVGDAVDMIMAKLAE